MPKIVNRLMKPFLQHYAMSWLSDAGYKDRIDGQIRGHIRKVAQTGIGRKLGVTPDTPIREVPFTHYDFYHPFFDNPKDGDFIYPLQDYLRVLTSGTMGKPKTFLLPKTGLWNSIQKTGMTFQFLCTHDGQKVTYEVGDVVYHNMPGGQFISGFYYDIITEKHVGWIEEVPDPNLSFQDKVDYFLAHYKEIDIAYMTVTTLLDQICPRIKEPIRLKAFLTTDRSAYALKDRIKEVTGSYPKTIFGSTETMFIALPSIEYPGCFFFDWRVVYPEFLPERIRLENNEETTDPVEEVVPMTDVKVGEIYQLITTPYGNDLVRYAMPDLVECVALNDRVIGSSIPVFRYYARADNLIVLHNFTRINEDELIDVLNRSGIGYVDFTALREIDYSREYMKMYIELKEPLNVEEASTRINKQLLEYDKDWRDLSDMLQYYPLKVELLPKGTFNRYLQRKTGNPKISRINMPLENLALLKDSTAQ